MADLPETSTQPASGTCLSPAKVNLFLAVTGLREDGFHNLVSAVAQTAFGDELALYWADVDTLETDHPDCPTDGTNLILKAVQAFRSRCPDLPPVHAFLKKRIPMGAGLGGGSSNATRTLLLLNEMTGDSLSGSQLHSIAAELGSDCPLFLSPGPKVIRGRGEQITNASPELDQFLKGKSLVLFRPQLSIPTAWAYTQIRAHQAYCPQAQAETLALEWQTKPEEAARHHLLNSFEAPTFSKFITYVPLFTALRELGLQPLLSGSGSACFALIPESIERTAVFSVIKDAWGDESVLALTHFL